MGIGHHVAKAKQEKEQAAAAESNEQIADDLVSEFEALPPEQQATAAPMMSMDHVIALIQATKSSAGLTAEDLKAILTEVTKSNAAVNAQAMQTAINRSNPDYVAKSPYHDAEGREAIPVYTVFMGPQHTRGKGAPLPRDMYSPIERDLINRFEVGQMKVARNGEWTAEAVRNGSSMELILKVPMTTMDQRQNLPSFSLLLRELLDGEVAVNPDALAERVAALERSNAELQQKLAAAGTAA